MVARGRVQNGVVVLADGVRLPEGQDVTVLASGMPLEDRSAELAEPNRERTVGENNRPGSLSSGGLPAKWCACSPTTPRPGNFSPGYSSSFSGVNDYWTRFWPRPMGKLASNPSLPRIPLTSQSSESSVASRPRVRHRPLDS